jgi:putative transposase
LYQKGYNKLKKKHKLKGVEISESKLVKKADGYYLQNLIFLPINPNETKNKPLLGIDFGIKDTITCSNGLKFNFDLSGTKFDKRKRRKQRELSRKIKGSKNYIKAKKKKNKVELKERNFKDNAAKQLIGLLTSIYNVVYQNDDFSSWRKTGKISKRKLQNGILGRCKNQLKNKLITNESHEISQYTLTSQVCSNCGTILPKGNRLPLNERTFTCSCGYKEDRDINAAKVIKKQIESVLGSRVDLSMEMEKKQKLVDLIEERRFFSLLISVRDEASRKL